MAKKKPFSGKLKKAQLAEKKARRRVAAEARACADDADDAQARQWRALADGQASVPVAAGAAPDDKPGNADGGTTGKHDGGSGPRAQGGGDDDDDGTVDGLQQDGSHVHRAAGTHTRFALLLGKESKEDIARRVALARQPLVPAAADSRTTTVGALHTGRTERFLSRPAWDPDMTASELARREETALDQYIQEMHREALDAGLSGPSFFEANIETWRQLWHVLDRYGIVVRLLGIGVMV